MRVAMMNYTAMSYDDTPFVFPLPDDMSADEFGERFIAKINELGSTFFDYFDSPYFEEDIVDTDVLSPEEAAEQIAQNYK